MAKPTIRKVCPWGLRNRFNESRLAEREDGVTIVTVIVSDAPVSPVANQPAGSRSQFVEYWEAGILVAKCHRYLGPSGALGASGRPDPKWLLVDGEVWGSLHDDQTHCPDCWEPAR